LHRPPPVDDEGDTLRPSPIDGLFTATQRRLLRFVFGQPDRPFCVRELRDLAGCGAGATQRELYRLARAGLVSVTRDGNRYLVQADVRSPIHGELSAMVRKTVALAEPLREALSAIEHRIDFAFAFEPERDPIALPCWDLGVLVVAEQLDALSASLLAARDLAEHLVGRSIWMMERTPEAFEADYYVAQIRQRPRVWVFGEERS
jgi:hypothetical protein